MNTNNQYVEMTRFALKDGISDGDLFSAEQAVRAGAIQKQPGYLGRELSRDAEGFWLVAIRWDSKASADAWASIFKSLKEGQAFGALLSFPTARREQYSRVLADEDVVMPFYTQALTVSSVTTSTPVLEKLLADDFQSINGQETKTKVALIKQVEFFWKLIPDLKWEPQDVIAAGSKVIVRSVASGSPKGSFMGVELDGTRTFKIDTTDIHEIAGGKIVRVHHLEDWATAMKQLRG